MEDEKIQMLSEQDQRRFVMLLCVRCCNGNQTFQDHEIAWKLRIDETAWKQTKKNLTENGLIDEAGKPLKWNKCQYVSDTSTERVKRFRERQKKKENETFQKRCSNVSETVSNTKNNAIKDVNETQRNANETQRNKMKQYMERSTENTLIGETEKTSMGNKCQYSLDTSIARERRDYERQEKKRNGNVTFQKRFRNVYVTAPDTETETETDIKHKTISSKLSCETSELEASPVIALPTNRYATENEMFFISEAMAEEFWRAYPAVDIREQLKKIRAWLLCNEKKRKTKRGMLRFVNAWLSKQQDSDFHKPVNGSTRNQTTEENLLNRDWANGNINLTEKNIN
jgi:hypothetical protein